MRVLPSCQRWYFFAWAQKCISYIIVWNTHTRLLKNAISNICGARKHEINFLTHLRLYIILCKEQRFVQVKIFNLLSWYVRTRRCASCASRLKTYSIFVFSIVSKLVLIGGGLFVKRKARYYFCKQHVRNICCLALLLSWNIVNK